MAEMENPGTNKTIRALISQCAGMVVLVDLVQVVADGQGQELFAMQLISYLDALRPGRKKSRKVEVPVAIVFTKADLFEEWIGDPGGLRPGQRRRACTDSARPGWSSCAFFCSGVAGSAAKLVDAVGPGEPGPAAHRAPGDHRAVRLDGQPRELTARPIAGRGIAGVG